MTYLLVCVFALSIMILLMPLLQRLALHIGAVDLPDGRKVHQVPIPRIGGVLITFAILLSLIVFAPLARELRALMAGSMVIAALGLTDDLIGVKAVYKFGLQWLVAAIFLAMIRPDFSAALSLPAWLLLPGAAFFMVGLINAVNLQDGLDGLAGGQVVISAICMALYLLYSGEWILVLVLAATISAVVGFLRVNTWPASIFMGDSGSYVLGFLLGGIFLLGLNAGALPWWSAVSFFALPIADTAQVIVGRLLAHHPVFSPDRRHLHHRLLDAGVAHQHVVFLEYMGSSILGLLPLLALSPLRLRWAALGLLILLSVAFAYEVTRRENRPPSFIPLDWFSEGSRSLSAVRWFILLALSGIYALHLATVQRVGFKYGLLPAGMALFYVAWSSIRLKGGPPSRSSTSLLLVVGAQLFIFHQFGPRGGGSPDLCLLHLGIWLALLACGALLLLLRFRHLLVIESPVDYLLFFAPVALLFLPVALKGSFRTDYLALELLCFLTMHRLFIVLLPRRAQWLALPVPVLGLALLVALGVLRG